MYRGELKAARRIAEEQLEVGEARQDPIWTVMGCMTCGSLCLLLGEFVVARQHLERGLGLYDPSQHSVYAALTAEDPQATAAADESFQQALAIAGYQSARLWELRAGLDLARLWRGQGKHSEARDLLGPIYGWFTEGFDTPVLKDAKSLLDQLA
jgi:predicted ATPase